MDVDWRNRSSRTNFSVSFPVPSKGPDTWREWRSDGKNLIIYWKVTVSCFPEYLCDLVMVNHLTYRVLGHRGARIPQTCTTAENVPGLLAPRLLLAAAPRHFSEGLRLQHSVLWLYEACKRPAGFMGSVPLTLVRNKARRNEVEP